MTRWSVFSRNPAHRTHDGPAAPTADAYAAGVLGVLESFPQRGEVCDACGCLCLPDEVCPGCRARRMMRS